MEILAMTSDIDDDMTDQPLYSPEFLESFELNPELQQDDDAISNAILAVLKSVGENPEREGLVGSPGRVSRMYRELLDGYRQDPQQLINDALFDVDYHEMVIVRDIDFASLCEHHLLPFVGKAHVAYIPQKRIIGLSKIPRIVDMFARRLQIQERLTQQIAGFLEEVLQPKGVAVVVEGMHMCSSIRGVKKTNAQMITSAMIGVFRENPSTRSEFLSLVSRS
jgi:GTP cyclohydrolase I